MCLEAIKNKHIKQLEAPALPCSLTLHLPLLFSTLKLDQTQSFIDIFFTDLAFAQTWPKYHAQERREKRN